MKPFVDMTKILTPGESGEAKIDFFEVDAQASAWTSIRGGRDFVPEGHYARLRVNGELMMTNTRMEQVTNYDIVNKATGDVLIAGLGLGMILVPILAKSEVDTVTVVEKYQGVIDLVGPKVANQKLSIVQADIMEWTPPKGRKWDTIYGDIWPDICTDNLVEVSRFNRKFRSRLALGGWRGCWMEDTLRDRSRRDKRAGW